VATKQKTVISAEPEHLRAIEDLIADGRYRTVSEFVREAVREKLFRLQRERLAKQVARYVADGHASEDDDLVAAQALPGGKRRS
jgi:Arc/MetJ-type ribon-helix-helix transcriptional regulator